MACLDLVAFAAGAARRLTSVVDGLMARIDGPMTANTAQGRVRPVIESVAPAVDRGRFAVKREVGDVVVVEAGRVL